MSTAPDSGRLPRDAPAPDSPGRKDAAARVARLFERHGRMVLGISRTLLRDPHDAEDATQQTFLSAYRALLGGTRIRDEGAWLATIARNECRARISAGMRAPLPIADEDLEAIPSGTDEAERSAQVAELRSAIAELPERQREAVVLRHLYGLSYGEVATALGLSRPATEALLFRARRGMRLRLRTAVATAIAVPLSVQEGLAQAIPGFGAAGAGGAVAGAAGGGVLAKLASGPVAAKLATAAVAVTTVGAVGTVESERAGRDRAERGGLVTTADSRRGDDSGGDDSSGHGRSGSSDDEGDERGSSGPGSGDERDDHGDERDGDDSGRGSSSSGDDGEREVDGDSRSGTSGGDDGRSGESASGSDDGGDGSGSGGGGGDDLPEPDDSSGSSGSGSSGSGSSGSGSGDDAQVETDSSGHGSGSDGSGSGEGSGSSGSGGGDEEDEPDE